MEEVIFGEFIKQRRKKLGLTQLQVCEGICEPITLSRLEHGRHITSDLRISALLGRLGLPDNRHLTVLSKREMEINNLQKAIQDEEVRFRRAGSSERPDVRERALKKLDSLERVAKKDNNLIQQYILGARVTFGKPDGPYSPDERMDMLMRAIRLTVPRFDVENIGQFRYSMEETKLINQLADAYSAAGNRKMATKIYKQLLAYVEHEDKGLPRFAGHFCLIAHNYAINLCLEKRYKESTAVATRGKQACVDHGHYQLLPGFLAILAECYFFEGDHEKSRKLYCQAYCIYEAIGDVDNCLIMKQEAKDRLDLEISF